MLSKVTLIAIAILMVTFSNLIAQEHKAEKPLEEAGYTWVSLKKDTFGRFVVKAQLNGEEFKLIIDWKMDRTILDLNKLEKLEMDAEETGTEYTINKDDDDLYVITVEKIEVGSGVMGEQDLYAVDFEEFDYLEDIRADGFLGSDFLFKYQAMIDLTNQRLYLYTK
jgi:hypothetical protein